MVKTNIIKIKKKLEKLASFFFFFFFFTKYADRSGTLL